MSKQLQILVTIGGYKHFLASGSGAGRLIESLFGLVALGDTYDEAAKRRRYYPTGEATVQYELLSEGALVTAEAGKALQAAREQRWAREAQEREAAKAVAAGDGAA